MVAQIQLIADGCLTGWLGVSKPYRAQTSPAYDDVLGVDFAVEAVEGLMMKDIHAHLRSLLDSHP